MCRAPFSDTESCPGFASASCEGSSVTSTDCGSVLARSDTIVSVVSAPAGTSKVTAGLASDREPPAGPMLA